MGYQFTACRRYAGGVLLIARSVYRNRAHSDVRSSRMPGEYGAISTLIRNHIVPAEINRFVTRFSPRIRRKVIAPAKGATAESTRACGLTASMALHHSIAEVWRAPLSQVKLSPDSASGTPWLTAALFVAQGLQRGHAHGAHRGGEAGQQGHYGHQCGGTGDHPRVVRVDSE
jgi:hypothetical protein